jgi:hydrogenase expression/formation protein HypD
MSRKLTLNELLDGYRNADTIKYLSKEIHKLSGLLEKKIRVMEVCGGHTHIIAKYGLEQIIPDSIEFIHGPGCPVCIMPMERIDHAYVLSREPDVILVTLGDMMKVPGSLGSLFDARAGGADIRFVYSPVDALEIARENAGKKIIFFAIGFETTTPMTAALIKRQRAEGLNNILYHINHVTVPEPMEAVISEDDSSIDAFIAPSHVSVITGAKIYQPLVEKYRLPIVVAGFEPVDIMESVLMTVRQFVEKRNELEIEYKRGVSFEGNINAQRLIDEYFEKAPSFTWRGIGEIPESSLKLREEHSDLDAEMIYTLPSDSIDDQKGCICGEILKGKAKPFQCGSFGKSCTPLTPMGACMVSDEGSCSAYFRYGRFEDI